MTQAGMLGFDAFRQVVAWTPLVSIDLVVYNAHGQLLLGMRRNRPARGYWFVPGGRIFKNETLNSAFARIARDELGRTLLRRADAGILGIYEHFYDDSFAAADEDTHYVVLAYQITVAAPQLEPPCVQHSAYRWFEPAELLAARDVHPHTKAYLEKKP